MVKCPSLDLQSGHDLRVVRPSPVSGSVLEKGGWGGEKRKEKKRRGKEREGKRREEKGREKERSKRGRNKGSTYSQKTIRFNLKVLPNQ